MPPPASAIRCTPEHPWFVAGEGWVAARDLAAGDELVGSDGSAAFVAGVRVVAESARTFNLEVRELHTYFVAADASAPAVWVHNACVWDSIAPTQPNHPGTLVPRSFNLSTPNGTVWLHGNATKHLAEYANALVARGLTPEAIRVATQTQLTSLQAAIEAATAKGIPSGIVTVGGWELGFSPPRVAGGNPVVYHALMK